MKQLIIDKKSIRSAVLDICQQMFKDNQRPTIVCGISRGGLIPGVMFSHFLNLPFYAINKNMFGEFLEPRGTILIVDDINDTGETFRKLEEYFYSRYPHQNRIYVSIVNNEASPFDVQYSYLSINKMNDPCWVVFPWETWWKF